MILFLYLIEPCIINNYNLVDNLDVHNILILVIFFKQFIVFNNILFNLNLKFLYEYYVIVVH